MDVPMMLLISWKSHHLCGGIYRQSLFIFQFRTALHEVVMSAAGRREMPHVGTPSSHADSFYATSFIHHDKYLHRQSELASAISPSLPGDDQSWVSQQEVRHYSFLGEESFSTQRHGDDQSWVSQ
jgi:hypothetical protein